MERRKLLREHFVSFEHYTRSPASILCSNDAESNMVFACISSFSDAEDEDEAVYEETGAYQSSETQSNPPPKNHPPPKVVTTGGGSSGGSSGGSGGSSVSGRSVKNRIIHLSFVDTND